jgi:hypothetical protein
VTTIALVTKSQVRAWMLRNGFEVALDKRTLEINTTLLAESAAHEFDRHMWLDDETHWIWELAFQVGEIIEKEIAK